MNDHDTAPLVCPSCNISIMPGTSHGSLQGCYDALKQFVILCQDEIESSRMHDFQHPTRDELMRDIAYLEDQFERFVIYVDAVRKKIADARRGTLVG
jgi:hypothetical protein